jgi:hypothetical protein
MAASRDFSAEAERLRANINTYEHDGNNFDASTLIDQVPRECRSRLQHILRQSYHHDLVWWLYKRHDLPEPPSPSSQRTVVPLTLPPSGFPVVADVGLPLLNHISIAPTSLLLPCIDWFFPPVKPANWKEHKRSVPSAFSDFFRDHPRVEDYFVHVEIGRAHV